MDAWSTLLLNSTAPDGSDAWTHLLSQEGVIAGECTGLVLIDGLELDMEDRCVEIEIAEDTIYVVPDIEEFELEIETFEFDIEVC